MNILNGKCIFPQEQRRGLAIFPEMKPIERFKDFYETELQEMDSFIKKIKEKGCYKVHIGRCFNGIRRITYLQPR